MLSTDLAVAPVQVIEWFVLRWQLEVTFQEVGSKATAAGDARFISQL